MTEEAAGVAVEGARKLAPRRRWHTFTPAGDKAAWYPAAVRSDRATLTLRMPQHQEHAQVQTRKNNAPTVQEWRGEGGQERNGHVDR